MARQTEEVVKKTARGTTGDSQPPSDAAVGSNMAPTTAGDSSDAKAAPKSKLGDRVQSLRLNNIPQRQTASLAWVKWVVAVAILLVIAWFIRPYLVSGYNVLMSSVASVETESDDSSSTSDSAGQQSSTPAATSSTGSGSRNTSTGSSAPSPANSNQRSLPLASGIKVMLEAKGYIIPAHQILVSPKVSGMITMLQVEEGRRVEQGELLAVLESTEYESDARRARATVSLAEQRLLELKNGNRPQEIAQASAELGETVALLPQLEADYERNIKLLQDNAISVQEVDRSRSELDAAQKRKLRLEQAFKLMVEGARKERIAIAEAELEQAEADLMKAEWRLSSCKIIAPISGTILEKNAEVGNLVNPVAFNGSFSLCEMADLSDLEVDLSIQEREISVVFVGQRCRIRADAYPTRDYEGYVDRLMPIADRAKGAIPVRVKIKIPAEEEGVYLKPEMGAIVTFYDEKVEMPERSKGPEVLPTFVPERLRATPAVDTKATDSLPTESVKS